MKFSKNEIEWNNYNAKCPDYIEVPHGVNPYDYDNSCGLAQIFKFGYRQAKRGRSYNGLGEDSTTSANEAFKRGYESVK